MRSTWRTANSSRSAVASETLGPRIVIAPRPLRPSWIRTVRGRPRPTGRVISSER